MRTIRRLCLFAWLSYRGLFTWLNPWGYFSSQILMPVMITLLFGSVGRYLGHGAEKSAIGAAIFAVGTSTMYGVNLVIANERQFGTLAGWLMSPQRLLTGLLGKSLIPIVDAMLGAAITLTTASLVFNLSIHPNAAGALAACVAAAAISGGGLGVAAASLSVRFRDVFTAPNIADCLVLIGSGAIVATALVPAHLAAVGQVLPVNHAIQAAHAVIDGSPLPMAHLGWELLIGLTWGAIGYGTMLWLSTQARRNAAHDLI
jgi:ABC-2 type transport system permease protein